MGCCALCSRRQSVDEARAHAQLASPIGSRSDEVSDLEEGIFARDHDAVAIGSEVVADVTSADNKLRIRELEQVAEGLQEKLKEQIVLNAQLEVKIAGSDAEIDMFRSYEKEVQMQADSALAWRRRSEELEAEMQQKAADVSRLEMERQAAQERRATDLEAAIQQTYDFERLREDLLAERKSFNAEFSRFEGLLADSSMKAARLEDALASSLAEKKSLEVALTQHKAELRVQKIDEGMGRYRQDDESMSKLTPATSNGVRRSAAVAIDEQEDKAFHAVDCEDTALDVLWHNLEPSLGTLPPKSSLDDVGAIQGCRSRRTAAHEAEPIYRQALAKKEQQNEGKEHPAVFAMSRELARCLMEQCEQKRASEAEQLFRRVLQGFEDALGVDHAESLLASIDLAECLLFQGKSDRAEMAFLRALTGCQRTFGLGDSHTLLCTCGLADCLQDLAQISEAEDLMRRSHSNFVANLGHHHLNALLSLSYLAQCLSRRGLWHEAECKHREAFLGFQASLGEKHPHTLTAVSNLILSMENQGKSVETEPLHRRVLSSYMSIFGRRHPSTLQAANNLAEHFRSHGNEKDALQLHEETLRGFEECLGDDDANTLVSMSNLATCLEAVGRTKEASCLYSRVLARRQILFGSESLATLHAAENLMCCLEALGDISEAVLLNQRLIAGYSKIFGGGDARTTWFQIAKDRGLHTFASYYYHIEDI